MLKCLLPARRIGQRWGATRAPRRGNDGGAGLLWLALFYPAPLEFPQSDKPKPALLINFPEPEQGIQAKSLQSPSPWLCNNLFGLSD